MRSLWPVAFAALASVAALSPAQPIASVPTPQPADSLAPHADTLPVAVDPRTELLAIIFRLIDAGEYNDPRSDSPYARAVAEHFAPYRDHPTLRMARQLRETQSIGFDAVACFAPYLRDIQTCELVVPLDTIPPNLARWTPQSARDFAKALRQFAIDTKFNDFWNSQADFRAKAEERMREALSKRPYRQMIESFFGRPLTEGSTVIIGLLHGGSNYGCAVQSSAGLTVFPTIGVWTWDESGLPLFPDSVTGTIVHEFCHPFVNPIIDAHYESFKPAGEWLFDARGMAMRAQAYADPRVTLYETLVRACVTSIMLRGAGEERGREQMAEENARGFLFTSLIVKELDRFHADRVKYPTLDHFALELADKLNMVVRRPSLVLANLPQLVSLSPPDGARDLPREVTFTLHFDRPVDPQTHGLSFGTTSVEVVTPPAFNAQNTTYSVTLRFPAGARVAAWINRGGAGFATDDGFPLEETPFQFTIRG